MQTHLEDAPRDYRIHHAVCNKFSPATPTCVCGTLRHTAGNNRTGGALPDRSVNAVAAAAAAAGVVHHLMRKV